MKLLMLETIFVLFHCRILPEADDEQCNCFILIAVCKPTYLSPTDSVFNQRPQSGAGTCTVCDAFQS